MAFTLTWSPEALEDIESIASYIEKDSSVYAHAVVSKFFEKVELLLDFPKMGRVVPEMGDENIRELFIYSYRLIYKLHLDLIVIAAVIHGKRNLEQ